MVRRTDAIAIVGAGRLGGALWRALRQAGAKPTIVRRGHLHTRALPASDAVLLCVPDRAIAEVAGEVAPRLKRGAVIAHCAGALGLEVLGEVAERGLHAGSLHPLCAVPSPKTSLAGAWAAIEGDAVATRKLSALARAVELEPFRLAAKDRALYHAAAALASNGLVGLAAEASELLARCGLSRDQAIDALVPLMESALRGLERERLPRALTGPIARGDAAVVGAHLEAIARRAPRSTAPLYRAIGEVLVRVAGELGGAAATDLARVRRRLSRGAK